MAFGEKMIEIPLGNPFADEAHELSQAEREAVHKIEGLPILATDQAMTLLVWDDKKPASIVDFVLAEDDLGMECQEADFSRLTRVKQFIADLKSIGLNTTYIAAIDVKRGSAVDRSLLVEDHLRFAVAKDETIARIVQEEQIKRYKTDQPVDDLRLGLALGFPVTAAQAYAAYGAAQELYREKIRQRVIRRGPYPQMTDYLKAKDELPASIRQAPFFRSSTAQYFLSKDHWPAELDTMKTWYEAVQRLSPAIHQACLKDR